jgi:hypothetical protein
MYDPIFVLFTAATATNPIAATITSFFNITTHL